MTKRSKATKQLDTNLFQSELAGKLINSTYNIVDQDNFNATPLGNLDASVARAGAKIIVEQLDEKG